MEGVVFNAVARLVRRAIQRSFNGILGNLDSDVSLGVYGNLVAVVMNGLNDGVHIILFKVEITKSANRRIFKAQCRQIAGTPICKDFYSGNAQPFSQNFAGRIVKIPIPLRLTAETNVCHIDGHMHA